MCRIAWQKMHLMVLNAIAPIMYPAESVICYDVDSGNFSAANINQLQPCEFCWKFESYHASKSPPARFTFNRAFIDAVRRIKIECPGCKISGGVSNFSFAFRGQGSNSMILSSYHKRGPKSKLKMKVSNVNCFRDYRVTDGRVTWLG